MTDVKELLNLMHSHTAADQALVTKAYAFAEDAHKTQTRYSGEPYFIHLFSTAKTLATLGMDAQSVAAGLLHDVLEDAGVEEATLEREFGREILFLVQGVTKLGKLRYHGTERHIESLRKILVAMSQDIRVLIIKLADRLHNMETLEHVPEHKRRRIALETLEIYAPLAHRMGIGRLRGQLEDLAFKYVSPQDFKKTQELLKERGEVGLQQVEKIHKTLATTLAKEGMKHVTIDHRIKHLYSLHQKLVRKDMDIEKVYDIAALRVVVENIADCYRVLGIIHSIWRPLPGRIKDYIAVPKPNGYRGLHTTIFTGDEAGGIVEVQIRSADMHQKAEYGVASHMLAYKEGQKLPEHSGISNFNLAWFKNLLPGNRFIRGATKAEVHISPNRSIPSWVKELAETQAVAKDDEFMRNLKTDFFEHRMFVFTPRGDVVDLPIDSTPVDFAYAIHSGIGDHMAGVKVNGKMVNLETALKNGDIVEIITKQSASPKRKWLSFAKTTLARRHIRNKTEDTDIAPKLK